MRGKFGGVPVENGHNGQAFGGLLCDPSQVGEDRVVSYQQVRERESERSTLILIGEKMKDLDIYEVEYSCSPGGVDKWEIQEREGDFFQGNFDNAEEAISYALYKFGAQELNLNVKSLEWYNREEAMKEKKEWRSKLDEATEEALMDFWAKIVDIFPEAEGGDFPPDLSLEMHLTMEKMLHHWLSFNHPTYAKEVE